MLLLTPSTVRIEAAIAVGMWTIGLGSSDRFKTSDVILPNLIDVHWSDLQRNLEASVRANE